VSTFVFSIQPIAPGSIVRENPAGYGTGHRTDPGRIGADLLAAIGTVARASARIVEGEAAFIARIHETKAHEKLGFHFEDLAREVFLMDPRTARNRLALHRTLAARPAVRQAFLSGDVSACQLLVIGKILTAENEHFWLEQCRSSTVSDLVRKIRRGPQVSASALSTLDDPTADHAEMRSVSFEIPPFARLAWNDGMTLARKVLGY
jgi:hypothetical protein